MSGKSVVFIALMIVAAVVAVVIGLQIVGGGHGGGAAGDTRFIGDNAELDRAIVFIHGVLGGEGTWKNESRAESWPELVYDDEDFQKDGRRTADVFVLEYPAGGSDEFTIQDAALHMLQTLRKHELLSRKGLTFVCHSMGGLVALEFLTGCGRKHARQVELLYLVATPGSGSAVANLGAMFSKNPQFGQMVAGGSSTYTFELRKEWLDLKRDEKLTCRVKCAYETRPTFGVRIVDDVAATYYAEDTEGYIPCDTDHIDIAKPIDRDAAAYVGLSNEYESLDTPDSSESVPDKNLPPIVSLSARPEQAEVPFSVKASAGQSRDPEGKSLQFKWRLDGKPLATASHTVDVAIKEPGTYDLEVEISDGVEAVKGSVKLRGLKRQPRVHTERKTAMIVTGRADARRIRGKDNEIDTDDWTRIDVKYSTRIVSGGKAVYLDLTWEAHELERSKRYKRGNTSFQSKRSILIWQARGTRTVAVAVSSGGHGRASYYVRGKCLGPRTYGPVGGIQRPVITIDAKGRSDHRAQAFRGALTFELRLRTE